MQMKILRPVHLSTNEFDQLEKKIKELFKKEIYLPLMGILRPDTRRVLKNTVDDDLLEAIQSGRVTFYRGKFSGKFNARLSKALRGRGAVYNRKTKTFDLRLSKLPLEFRMAISSSTDRFDRVIYALQKKITEMLPEKIADKLDSTKIFDSTIYKTNLAVEETLKGLVVGPQLTELARQRIAEEYSTNMQKYIQEWTEQEILKLRKLVEKQAFAGIRYEDLAKKIEQRYGVSASKAKFLARQETHLLMAKFKESRYSDAGITEYVWKNVVGSPAHPVRPMHKRLDNTVQRWDDPPITDNKGSRNNPGEDYNCRCYPRAIVRF